MNTHDWVANAACREVDPELWYPAHGENGTIARRICAGCEVRAQCLADILAFEKDHPLDYRWGIHAGLDPRQRASILDGTPTQCGTMRGVRDHTDNGEDLCARCKNAQRGAEYRRNYPRRKAV